jgi:hypothetical protein
VRQVLKGFLVELELLGQKVLLKVLKVLKGQHKEPKVI